MHVTIPQPFLCSKLLRNDYKQSRKCINLLRHCIQVINPRYKWISGFLLLKNLLIQFLKIKMDEFFFALVIMPSLIYYEMLSLTKNQSRFQGSKWFSFFSKYYIYSRLLDQLIFVCWFFGGVFVFFLLVFFFNLLHHFSIV